MDFLIQVLRKDMLAAAQVQVNSQTLEPKTLHAKRQKSNLLVAGWRGW